MWLWPGMCFPPVDTAGGSSLLCILRGAPLVSPFLGLRSPDSAEAGIYGAGVCRSVCFVMSPEGGLLGAVDRVGRGWTWFPEGPLHGALPQWLLVWGRPARPLPAAATARGAPGVPRKPAPSHCPAQLQAPGWAPGSQFLLRGLFAGWLLPPPPSSPASTRPCASRLPSGLEASGRGGFPGHPPGPVETPRPWATSPTISKGPERPHRSPTQADPNPSAVRTAEAHGVCGGRWYVRTVAAGTGILLGPSGTAAQPPLLVVVWGEQGTCSLCSVPSGLVLQRPPASGRNWPRPPLLHRFVLFWGRVPRQQGPEAPQSPLSFPHKG